MSCQQVDIGCTEARCNLTQNQVIIRLDWDLKCTHNSQRDFVYYSLTMANFLLRKVSLHLVRNLIRCPSALSGLLWRFGQRPLCLSVRLSVAVAHLREERFASRIEITASLKLLQVEGQKSISDNLGYKHYLKISFLVAAFFLTSTSKFEL